MVLSMADILEGRQEEIRKDPLVTTQLAPVGRQSMADILEGNREIQPVISPGIATTPISLPDMPERQEKPKGLLKVLDILQRPNFAVAGGVKALIEGEPVLKEAVKGLLGKERDTFTDALGLFWTPETKVGKFAKGATGFALDVLLDPTTYIGIGTLTKAGKIAQKGAKLAPTVAKQAKLGQRALIHFMGKEIVKGERVFGKTGEILEFLRGVNLIDKLGKAYVPSFRPASVHPVIWEGLRKAETAKKNIVSYKDSKAFQKIVQVNVLTNKALAEHGDELLVKTASAIESPSLIKELPDDLAEIVKVSREYLDELKEVRKWAKKGIIDEEEFKYLPHVHKGDFLADIKNIFGTARVHTTKSPSGITREVFKFSDNAGNVLGIGKDIDLKLTKVGDKYLDGLDNAFKAELPTIAEKMDAGYIMEDNIATLLGIGGRRAAKLEGAKVYFDSVKHLAVNKGGLDTFTKITQAITSTAPELKGYLFHPELVQAIDKTYKAIQPEKLNAFLKNYDKIQGWWKGMATFVNPAFHSRNAVSNLYQNAIGGVYNPKVYGKAALIQAKLSGENMLSKGAAKISKDVLGTENAAKIEAAVTTMVEKYYDDFARNGLEGGTFFGTDIQESVAQKVSPTLFGSNKLGAAKKIGQKTGRTVEGNARLAHFIDKIDKGWSAEAAAKSVKEHLFDYEELTEFEINVMKRIIPFYTWTRKNLPLQLKSLATRPRLALGVGKAVTSIEKGLGTNNIEKQYLPDWLQNAGPIVVSNREGVSQVIKLEGYIPLADISKIIPETSNIQEQARVYGKEILDMTSPIIKVIPELIINKNLFFDKPIQEVEGERADLLRAHINPYVNHVLRQVRPLTELDKLIGRPYDKVSASSKGINLLFGGKLYNIDKKKSKAINAYLLRNKKSTIKSKIKYRMRIGDLKEAKRLRSLYRELPR